MRRLSPLLFVACSAVEPSARPAIDDPPPENPFAAEVDATRVVFEIDYQAGAEPYVGSTPAFGEQWMLFERNVGKLFEGTNKTIEIPTTLDRMERLDDVGGTAHTVDAILAIAERHRSTRTRGEILAYYVVWLDGYFSEGGSTKDQVLGVSIGGTGVIAMFKPVIESAALPLLPGIARIVEQVVLVHEVGHAVGLVNDGIPLATPHHDAPNGAHCTNDRCVMYFSVEGVAAAREFAQRRVTQNDLVLFDDACLGDVAAARR